MGNYGHSIEHIGANDNASASATYVGPAFGVGVNYAVGGRATSLLGGGASSFGTPLLRPATASLPTPSATSSRTMSACSTPDRQRIAGIPFRGSFGAFRRAATGRAASSGGHRSEDRRGRAARCRCARSWRRALRAPATTAARITARVGHRDDAASFLALVIEPRSHAGDDLIDRFAAMRPAGRVRRSRRRSPRGLRPACRQRSCPSSLAEIDVGEEHLRLSGSRPSASAVSRVRSSGAA